MKNLIVKLIARFKKPEPVIAPQVQRYLEWTYNLATELHGTPEECGRELAKKYPHLG